MPWTKDAPPRPAKNWSPPARALCARVANAVLKQSGKEDQAIYACIRAVKLKYPSQVGKRKNNEYEIDIDKFDLSELDDLTDEQLQSLQRQGAIEVFFAPWSTKQKNALPDGAYAIVYKRPDGKVIRALPHHKKDGSLDLSHLRNALARWNQVKGVPAGVKAAGRAHLEGHARKAKVGDKKAASQVFEDVFDITGITFEEEGEGESERHVTKGIPLAVGGKFVHPWYGEIDLSDAVLNEMKRNHDKKVLGTDVAIDERHDRGRALGWVKPGSLKRTKAQFRGREYTVLLGDIAWTPDGRRLLEEKTYKYFSPEFGTYVESDGKTEHHNVLTGGALTNRPFLKMMPSIKFDDEGRTGKDVLVLDEGTEDDELWELDDDTEEVYAFSVGFHAFDPDEELDDDEDDMAIAELIAKAKTLGLDVSDEASLEKALEQMTEMAKGDKEIRAKLKEAGVEFEEATPTQQVVVGAITVFGTQLQTITTQLSELTKRSKTSEAQLAVKVLLDDGKILPTQVATYTEMYTSDKKMFDSLTATLPKLINFGEIGGIGVVDEPGQNSTEDLRQFNDPTKAETKALEYLEKNAGLTPKSKSEPVRFDPATWRRGQHVSEARR